ncbi:MAG: potassium channel protein [Myxococcales bacterium]|nr:potassium channel protein [Myxococcales bacterium]
MERGRQLLLAAVMLGVVILIGASGYRFLGEERWSWVDCLYMTVITLSTVGFGETLKGMSEIEGARIWTLLLILSGSGTLLFFVSTFTAFVIEGDIQGSFRRRRMQRRIDQLQGHFIVVGVGATGVHVVAELLDSKAPFVVIDTNLERLERVAEEVGQEMLYVHGDATEDGVLQQAGIGRAAGLAATLKEDKDNLFVSITARALHPELRIVSKMTEDSADMKLRRAGVDCTVSPSLIGGMRLASELVRPSVVQFLDRMRSQDLRVEELPVSEGSPLVGLRIRDTGIRHQTNALVLAVGEPDGSYSYNPGPDFTLAGGQILVVLCRTADVQILRRSIELGTNAATSRG